MECENMDIAMVDMESLVDDPSEDPIDKIPIRRRSSLFISNEVSASTSGPPAPPNPVFVKYEQSLKSEIDSWSRLLKDKIQEINEHKKNTIELDISLLSDEQRNYLNAGPKVEAYVQEANEFRTLAERYIQRKSYLAQRYETILSEARAQLDNKALDVVETELLSEKLEKNL